MIILDLTLLYRNENSSYQLSKKVSKDCLRIFHFPTKFCKITVLEFLNSAKNTESMELKKKMKK